MHFTADKLALHLLVQTETSGSRKISMVAAKTVNHQIVQTFTSAAGSTLTKNHSGAAFHWSHCSGVPNSVWLHQPVGDMVMFDWLFHEKLLIEMKRLNVTFFYLNKKDSPGLITVLPSTGHCSSAQSRGIADGRT